MAMARLSTSWSGVIATPERSRYSSMTPRSTGATGDTPMKVSPTSAWGAIDARAASQGPLGSTTTSGSRRTTRYTRSGRMGSRRMNATSSVPRATDSARAGEIALETVTFTSGRTSRTVRTTSGRYCISWPVRNPIAKERCSPLQARRAASRADSAWASANRA
jgi:YD repeat-containing protein